MALPDFLLFLFPFRCCSVARPAPSQPAHFPILGLNLYLLTGFLPISAAASIYLFERPYAIGSVPSLSGHHAIIAYRCVYCRKFAGTESSLVVLKVFPVTGAAILQVTIDQLMCASLFPHPLLVLSGHVDRRRVWRERCAPLSRATLRILLRRPCSEMLDCQR